MNESLFQGFTFFVDAASSSAKQLIAKNGGSMKIFNPNSQVTKENSIFILNVKILRKTVLALDTLLYIKSLAIPVVDEYFVHKCAQESRFLDWKPFELFNNANPFEAVSFDVYLKDEKKEKTLISRIQQNGGYLINVRFVRVHNCREKTEKFLTY